MHFDSKRLKNMCIAGTIALLPFLALATSHSVEPPRSGVREVRGQTQQERRELKQTSDEKRDVLRMGIKERHGAVRDEIRTLRDTFKEEKPNLTPEERRAKRTEMRHEIKDMRETLHNEVHEKREAFRAEKKERVEAFRGRLGELRAKRIEAYFAHMVRKLEAAVDRLEKLADRIDSRLDKFEDKGKSVAEFRTALDGTRTQIAAVEDVLEQAKTAFGKMAVNENPKEKFAEVRDLVKGVTAKIKEAHRALVDVIKSIKGASDIVDSLDDTDDNNNDHDNDTATSTNPKE